MKKFYQNKGLTLVELLAAGIITVTMMIAIASMDISLRNIFQSTSFQGILAVRTAVIMNHISHRVFQGAGNSAITSVPIVNDIGVGIEASPDRLWVRIDNNRTPSDHSDDTWYFYAYNSPNLAYYSTSASGSGTHPTGGVVGTCIKTFPNVVAFQKTLTHNQATNDFSLFISITCRYNASLAMDPITNPEYTLTSTFSIPSSGSTI